jgi:hypothetical protein
MKLILLTIILFVGTLLFVEIVHFTRRKIPLGEWFLTPIYFVWAFVCVYATQYFTSQASVTWDWLYWLVGVLFCVSLPTAVFGKIDMNKSSSEEERAWAFAQCRPYFITVSLGLGVALWFLVFK